MNIEKTFIEGLLVFNLDIFNDERGYFFESFNRGKYSEFNFNENFIQDNISKSRKGTVRGLHYQVGEYAQGKLCTVLNGKVLDVAVDIRFGSPTFGKYFSIELGVDTKKQLWIPPGFAHGFSVLEDDTVFMYKCTAPYNKNSERAILFNDPILNIDWKIVSPIVSSKDLQAANFKDINKDFSF